MILHYLQGVCIIYELSINEYVLSIQDYALSQTRSVFSIDEHAMQMQMHDTMIANAKKKKKTLPDVFPELEIKSSSPSSVSS
jgi:hypothetical protein